MDSASNLATAKQYLRRKFSDNLPALKALADQVAGEALGESVTLTGQTFEGGSHTGVLTFPRMDYLRAIESLIAELDPTVPVAPPRVVFADFGGSPAQV